MATLSQAKSQRMYSWWWDSHISPKNSRWLQENLTDMDSKVKSMIKLIEEDADSFARRAEMYYKKRPELMKLVEEFYRAYRALAERYDHATGALRQAHRTMSEAFPNQIPSLLPDDSNGSEADSRTPDMSTPGRVIFDTDDSQNDVPGFPFSHSRAGKPNGAFSEESDSVTGRKGSKQLSALSGFGEPAKFVEGRVRKGLNFHEAVDSERVGKFEKEISILKEAIARLEAEKDAGLKQYQQSLDSLSTLEAEVSQAKEDSRELREQASRAEAETQDLKVTLSSLEAEKEASLEQYNLCLVKISNLEEILSHAQKDAGDLDERANKAETEVHTLKEVLNKVEAEKDVFLNQYKQSLEKISGLEKKLLLAEENACKCSQRAEMAEGEVESLKLAISKLTKEKEAAALQYQQSLEIISSLELQISRAHDETQRLNGEIDNGAEKLKGAEERCVLLEMSNQSLKSDLETSALKMHNQSQELTEKQKELGRLWTCIQEERLRFLEAEIAFQTLQRLHSQAQDELRSLASELQNKAQILGNMEIHNKTLKDEILKLEEENKNLNELNVSSSVSMKGMQNEIFSLREAKGKLEQEVELRVDERNALQQEIYCLKEELKDLNNKHHSILKQVEAVGLSSERFETSVKELQDENTTLRISCQRERSEKEAVLEKLEMFEKLLEKNALLENSISDLGAELEVVRGKINVLEDSCQSLLQENTTLVDEKTTLMTQLQLTAENLGKLSETNTILENSLSDARDELEVLKEKAKSLEDSCLLLVTQKSELTSEKVILISQIENTQERLKALEKRFMELEDRFSDMENENTLTRSEITDLKVHMDIQKQEHDNLAEMSSMQLAGLVAQVHLLQEESWNRNRELEGELDKSLDSQVENFVLQRCVHDLEEKNSSLLIECQKLLQASKLSEKLISELEHENLEQQVEVKSLFDQCSMLRIGASKLLTALDVVLDHQSEDKEEQDKTSLDHILSKIQAMKSSICETQYENQLQAVQMLVLITLIGQLRSEAANLLMEKSIAEQELCTRTDRCLVLQNESQKLSEMTESLRLKLSDGYQIKEGLMAQMENLHARLLVMERSYEKSQEEKAQVLEEKEVLMKEIIHMEEKNRTMEEESSALFSEMISQNVLSLMCKIYVEERSTDMKRLEEDLDELHGINASLEKKCCSTEEMLKNLQMENLHLKETLHKSEHETNMWEAHSTSLYEELQTSTIVQTLLDKKVNEIIEERKSLQDENHLKNMKIKLLDERIGILEDQNEKLKVQLSPLGPAVTSLFDSISSLEKNTFLHTHLQTSITEEVKEDKFADPQCTDSYPNKDQNAMESDAVSNLQNLQARVKAIENTIIEMERFAMQESLNAYTKLESATKQIEELRSENRACKENGKPTTEIMEVDPGNLPKDIMLDHISESSSYPQSRRHYSGVDNQMYELWETTDQDSSVDFSVGKGKKIVRAPSKKEISVAEKQKSDYLSSEFQVEKDLSLNKPEISKRFTEPRQEGSKRKVLERLNSDVQKLINLQITVQDLKKKVEIIEKSRKGKTITGGDNTKQKLEEAEAAILKLFDYNSKLTKNIEDNSTHSGKTSAMESDESGSVRRRRISEQARRVSEKIGRLQLEMQRIQFELLKFDDEKESRGGFRVSESKRRVLLRDYLYGGVRKSPRRKKAPFCACMEPPTKGD